MTRDVRLAAYRSVALRWPENEPLTSQHIEEWTGVLATIVRRDLSSLGKLGVRGRGYDPDVLVHRLDREIAKAVLIEPVTLQRDALNRILADLKGEQ